MSGLYKTQKTETIRESLILGFQIPYGAWYSRTLDGSGVEPYRWCRTVILHNLCVDPSLLKTILGVHIGF